MAKSITEKVADIFVGAIARDLSKTAIKRAKELFAEKSTTRKRLTRKKNTELEPSNPDLEPPQEST